MVKPIYVVRAIRRPDPGQPILDMFRGGHGKRHSVVWGYFHGLDAARHAVENNATDLFEGGYYQYAVVSRMPPGLAQIAEPPEGLHWYEYFLNEGTISEIDHLPIATRFNWGLM